MNALYLDTKQQNKNVWSFRGTMIDAAHNLDTIRERFDELRNIESENLEKIQKADIINDNIVAICENAMNDVAYHMDLVERRYTLLRLQITSLTITITDLYNRSHLNVEGSHQIDDSDEQSEIDRNNNKVINCGRSLRWLEYLIEEKVDQFVNVRKQVESLEYMHHIYSKHPILPIKNRSVEVMMKLISDTDTTIYYFSYIAAVINGVFADLNKIIKNLPEEVRGNTREG